MQSWSILRRGGDVNCQLWHGRPNDKWRGGARVWQLYLWREGPPCWDWRHLPLSRQVRKYKGHSLFVNLSTYNNAKQRANPCGSKNNKAHVQKLKATRNTYSLDHDHESELEFNITLLSVIHHLFRRESLLASNLAALLGTMSGWLSFWRNFYISKVFSLGIS